jgi:hypothetical protein
MRRLLAVVLVALTATSILLPVAVASTTAIPIAHACCRRSGAHQCSGTDDHAFRAQRSCCQAPQPSVTVRTAQPADVTVVAPQRSYSYAAEFYPATTASSATAANEQRSPPAKADTQQ